MTPQRYNIFFNPPNIFECFSEKFDKIIENCFANSKIKRYLCKKYVNKFSVLQSNYVLLAREKYDSYDPSCWTKAYFDDVSGGFNVYHKDHQFTPTGGGGEAEKIVGILLAKHNGKQVEFLPEQGIGYPVPDLGFDELISAVNREVGYLEKSNRLSIMPNIYYMNKQGILTLIWHK